MNERQNKERRRKYENTERKKTDSHRERSQGKSVKKKDRKKKKVIKYRKKTYRQKERSQDMHPLPEFLEQKLQSADCRYQSPLSALFKPPAGLSL